MKYLKSKNGVTMISLVFYISSFFAITLIVAGITTFFYNNVEVMDTSIGSNSQYNKLNMYMLNETKKEGTTLLAWKNTDTQIIADTPNNIENLDVDTVGENTFLTFKDESGIEDSFIYVAGEKNLYFNSIKLCDNVEDFKFKIHEINGKTVLNVFININGTAFSTEYVVGA